MSVLVSDMAKVINYLNSIWLRGVPQGSVLVSFLSYVIVGKAYTHKKDTGVKVVNKT